MEKVIIIGGGASGLVSAIKLRRNGYDVTILERNNVCGKKILLTGNGRCNYFNEDFSCNHYHSSSCNDLSVLINDNNKNKILNFFNDLGVVPKIRDGYYYPNSNQATSIRNTLLNECIKLGVEIINDIYVTDIKKEDKFIINNEYICDKLVVSTGGMSYPKTGSDGNLYKILESLGHKIIKPLPALVSLNGNESYFKDWHGVRSDVSIKLYEDDNFIKEEIGEIQLTDYGISGICVMQLSSIIARGLDLGKKEKVIINFLPNYSSEWLKEYLIKNNNKKISEVLENIINYKLGNLIINKNNYNLDDLVSNINIDRIINNITNFNLDIISTNSFDSSQTTSGGVSLENINLSNMESNVIKDLYLTGEILDIDGDCGGYNLAFAWLSGLLVGDNND